MLYISICLLLFLGGFFLLPDLYAKSERFLVIGGIVILIAMLFMGKINIHNIRKADIWYVGIFLLFILSLQVIMFLCDDASRGLSKVPEYLLRGLLIMWLIKFFPPRKEFIWLCISLCAIVSGIYALWQVLGEGIPRAHGYMHPIEFGDLSLLIGVLNLSAIGSAMKSCHNQRIWVSLLSVGCLMGITASVLSGSRGGWCVFPVLLVYLYFNSIGLSQHARQKTKMAALFIVVLMIFIIPMTDIGHRFYIAYSEMMKYAYHGSSVETSTGARMEMWRGSLYLFSEKPLLGWGIPGREQGMAQLVDAGILQPYVLQYDHSHNDFLDMLSRRGLVGLSLLAVLYGGLLYLFQKAITRSGLQGREWAIGGVIVVLAYIGFGMTETTASHRESVQMFEVLIALFWGICSNCAINNNCKGQRHDYA